MRTNIEIDDKLMAKAMKAAGTTTKKETVEQALELLARTRQQAQLRKLRGSYKFTIDLEAMRDDGR